MEQLSEPERLISLGIDGSTDDVAGLMQRGQLYALEARIPSLRFPLIARALQSAFATGAACTVALKSKPDVYLTQLNTPQKLDLDAAFAAGALDVLVMREDFGKRMFQLGPARFTRELDGFGVVPGSLMVFEHAGDLLNMRDGALATRQLDALSAWCLERDCTGLLVFSGNPERNTVPVTDLLDSLSGLALVEAGRGQLTIDVPYWKCHDRLSSCLHISLRLDHDGYYRTTRADTAGTAMPQATEIATFASEYETTPVPGADAWHSLRAPHSSTGHSLPRSFEGRAPVTAGLARSRKARTTEKAIRARFSDVTETA